MYAPFFFIGKNYEIVGFLARKMSKNEGKALNKSQ
jgi:hypothetical protein